MVNAYEFGHDISHIQESVATAIRLLLSKRPCGILAPSSALNADEFIAIATQQTSYKARAWYEDVISKPFWKSDNKIKSGLLILWQQPFPCSDGDEGSWNIFLTMIREMCND